MNAAAAAGDVARGAGVHGGVAIVGLGVVSAIGHDVASFTAALERGASGVDLRRTTAGRSAGAVAIAAQIRDFDLERATHALGADDGRARARRLGARASLGVQTSLAAALEAWSHAGLGRARPPRERVGVVVAGSNLSQGESFRMHTRHAADATFANPKFALQFLDTNYVGVLSEALGTGGEGFTVGGASASGNVALVRALDLIALDRCDACVVVGPAADLSDVELHAFHSAGALAKKYVEQPAKACRPFDRDHDGFVYGEASACVILESRASAAAREATVLAELSGGAVLVDGNASTNPSAAGEARAMREALRRAGRDAARVDYVNAHGSSSKLGDDAEVAAIREVLGARAADVFVNSTKELTGHCLFSAGLVEAIATVAQMRGGFVHANANLDEPAADGCRFVGREARRARIDCALSNSFGFAGINSAIVLSRSEP